ncbi:MAG: hypothetical protein HWN65_16985 [Candidatus Helarchaeota archaeon]|nr:hypothetical protein [Candidatus Helarchaeota archaeon]
MNELMEQKKDWKLFYFPLMILLTGYILFGKLEIMIVHSSDSSPFGWAEYLQYFIFVLIMFVSFGVGYILFYKFLTKNQHSSNNLKILYVGILTLVVAFVMYNICEEFMGVYGDGFNPVAIKIPNFLSWFISYVDYSSFIEISWYHILIFFIFFPLIGYGFTIMDYLHFKDKKRTLRLLIMFFGAHILGLMWQDFYTWVAHPTDYLAFGEQYGVYFDQWLGPIPIIYVVANCLGLGIIWLAVSLKSGIKYREIYRFLLFIGIICAIGVIIHTVKIPFMP